MIPEWLRIAAQIVFGFYVVAGFFLLWMWKIGKTTYSFAKVEYRSDSFAYIQSWSTRTKVLHFVLFAAAGIIALEIV